MLHIILMHSTLYLVLSQKFLLNTKIKFKYQIKEKALKCRKLKNNFADQKVLKSQKNRSQVHR